MDGRPFIYLIILLVIGTAIVGFVGGGLVELFGGDGSAFIVGAFQALESFFGGI